VQYKMVTIKTGLNIYNLLDKKLLEKDFLKNVKEVGIKEWALFGDEK